MTEDATEENLIEFKCPHCGEANAFRATEAGTVQECPYCAQAIVVPLESTEVGLALPIPIKTPRLLLRRLEPGDAPDMLEIATGDEWFRYLNVNPLNEEEMDQWLERDLNVQLTRPERTLNLGIVLAEGGKLIGWSWINGLDETHRRAWIGVVIEIQNISSRDSGYRSGSQSSEFWLSGHWPAADGRHL